MESSFDLLYHLSVLETGKHNLVKPQLAVGHVGDDFNFIIWN